MRKSSNTLIEFAFWQSYIENTDSLMTTDELDALVENMRPLIIDALDYYLDNYTVPMLEEEYNDAN